MSETIAHLPVALTPLAYGTDHDEDHDGPASCQNFDSPREEELDHRGDDALFNPSAWHRGGARTSVTYDHRRIWRDTSSVEL